MSFLTFRSLKEAFKLKFLQTQGAQKFQNLL